MISLDGLNPSQREAAGTLEGPVLILAGAGSGKTRTITFRMAHMVKNCGIPPEKILGVSFTNKAAKEMRERVAGLLGNHLAAKVHLSTFHSLGVQILKKDIEHLGYEKNFTIYDTSDQLGVLRQALKVYNGEKNFDLKTILGKIGFLKNKGITEFEYSGSKFFDSENPYDLATEYAYKAYQEKLKFFNAIDFDDILLLTKKLLHNHPEMAKKYSQAYQYIMVDEYQDTNPLQFQIVLALTSTHQNLCVVGDDDQAIYSWRGAEVSNILDFDKHFQDAKVIKLQENYRSTIPILDLANVVIKENLKRSDKSLIGITPSNILPEIWQVQDSDHEAQSVISEIKKFEREGASLDDMAILYRSSTQVPPFEDQLRMDNVNYKILGGQKFYEKKEVKDLIAYLSLILNSRDEVALRRIINTPTRGIGAGTLAKFIEKAKEKNTTLFRAMEHFPMLDPQRGHYIKHFVELIRKYQGRFRTESLDKALEELIEDIQFNSYIEKQYDHNPKQLARRKNDVLFFIDSAKRFSQRAPQKVALKFFVEKLLLQDSQDRENQEEEKNVPQITLMSLHSSKGLEFDHVFLIGAEEELLPHKKTIKEGEDVSEERRLLYVGITRAKKKLVITYCKERTLFGNQKPRHISRFLKAHAEDDKLVNHQDRTTFQYLSPEAEKEFKTDFFSNMINFLDG